MKILHIENDYEFTTFLRENLLMFGVEVETFLSSDEAIDHFEHNRDYDIIICDGDPGEFDGTTVVETLRQIDTLIPIVAQSDFPRYIEKMFNSGANWAIPRNIKETDMPKLFDTLRELSLRFPR